MKHLCEIEVKRIAVWTASTITATYLHIDRSRSREALSFIGSLSQRPVVTDRYAVYNQLEQPHQYCLVHVIRDCRKYSEKVLLK